MANKEFATHLEFKGVRRYFKDSRFNPVVKIDEMTQDVGLDNDGKLYTTPGFNIHGLTVRNTLDDDDEMAFHDASASAQRKTTWGNIKSKLKSYFDTIYLNGTSLIGYATKVWVQSQGYGTYTKPSNGIPENDLSNVVKTKLNKTNIITIDTEGADPLNPYKSSKTLGAIKADFNAKFEQFVFYDNISYKLEKIITDNGVEKAVFYSNSRLISNVLTYYTCEIYDGDFGYSVVDFHTYTVSGGGAGTVASVNGQTGVVMLDASDVGAQRTLIPGSGIMIIEGEDGDIIQSDASGGSGIISFVDTEGGAPIAQFMLNQMQDYEINVNVLTAQLGSKVNNLETSLSNNYRTATQQNVIDNTKLTDAPSDGKQYARKNGGWTEVVGKVQMVNGQTGVVVLNANNIRSTKTPTILPFVVDGSFIELLIGVRRNNTSGPNCTPGEVSDALQSGFGVTIGVHDQDVGSDVVFSAQPIKYEIKNDKVYLYILADHGHAFNHSLFVVDGSLSRQYWDTTEYQYEAYHSLYDNANYLPSPHVLTVEEYLEALEARIVALENS